MKQTERYCKDCKHMKRDKFFFFDSAFFRCGLSENPPDLVGGRKGYQLCCIERDSYNEKRCGSEGNLYQQKDKWWEI